jgi:hypothetical protein
MTRARTIVSAGVSLYINGKRMGRVTSFEFNSATPRRAIHGLDALDPFELAPVSTRVSGRLGFVRTVGDGGAEGQGLTTQYDTLPLEKYFSIMLIERISDTVIFEANYCSVVNQSWSVQPKSMVTGMVEFEALDWNNEF